MSEQKEVDSKNWPYAFILLAPFVFFALIEFAPWWVSSPACLVIGLLWVGCWQTIPGAKKPKA